MTVPSRTSINSLREKGILHRNGSLVQLVEWRSPKPLVGGSSPSRPAGMKKIMVAN